MHWVIKVVEAMVGAAERRAYTQHERNIASKNNANRAGFRQIFNLQHENEGEAEAVSGQDA